MERQAELIHDQMNALAQRKDEFIYDEDVQETNFGLFGLPTSLENWAGKPR